MKYTQGPWHLSTNPDSKFIYSSQKTRSGNFFTIASADFYEPLGYGTCARANAILIAAAPEMLNALLLMRDALGESFTKEKAKEAYHAVGIAIAKATGEHS
jgi:hypothetical protein